MRPNRFVVLVVVVALAALSGCRGSAGEDVAPAEAPALERRSAAAARREVTRPAQLPIVQNSARGRSRFLIARAVRDLQRLGLWGRLTRPHRRVYLSSRGGHVNVPEDGHLADSLRTAELGAARAGTVCDVRFYPAAIARDLSRQWEFWERGLLDVRPGTLRQFWVALLAHELVHCLPAPKGGRGESAARRWEARVLGLSRALI